MEARSERAFCVMCREYTKFMFILIHCARMIPSGLRQTGTADIETANMEALEHGEMFEQGDFLKKQR